MFRGLMILISLLVAAPASAQLAGGRTMIRPELVVEQAAIPGGGVELALSMHTTPGWHG